jgi:tripartite-type tricarboxylate transporter receptor subunit TctC
MKITLKFALKFTLVFAIVWGQGFLLAQNFPNRPIRLMVQYPAGGAIDVLARNVAQRAQSELGQPIVVDNKPGASGFIAFDACAKAAADGYTVCLGTGEGMSLNPFMFAKMPYDPARDFVAVADLVRISGVIIASAKAPYDSMAELISYAKSNPKAINWASFGVGSNPHIYLSWIDHQAKIEITHVPYKGSTQTIPALLSGESDVTYVALGFVLPLIKSGKLKALAVTTPKRLPQLPNVPTLNELGLDPGTQAWVGIFAPTKTPSSVVEQLNLAFSKAVHDPVLNETFLSIQAFEPVVSTQEAFATFTKQDRQLAQKVIQATNIKLEPQ